MKEAETKIPCVGCGALVLDFDGPTHRYVGASPGCWAVFGEMRVRETTDPQYRSVPPWTVDTYMVQHPGTPSNQSIQSVAVHLIALHLALEEGCDSRRTIEAMRAAHDHRDKFRWLDPPASLGTVTIMDVYTAGAVEEYIEQVRLWAHSVWDAWALYHETVRQWSARYAR